MTGSLFDTYSHNDITDLIAAYPLAVLISEGAREFASTPLPMLADTDDEGRLINLVGHMALSNPQVEALRVKPRCCFLFQGPNGYISPRYVPDRDWAPTWNYALVRVHAELEFHPDKNDAALKRLVAYMEAGHKNAWSVEEMGERYEKLSHHVIAFDARVTSIDARFKLGQDERRNVFDSILNHLDQPDLVDWMRRFDQR